MYNTNKNVTPIDMLPDLEDLEINESVMQYHPSNMGGRPYMNPATQGGSSYATNSNYPGIQMIPNNEIERVGRYIRGGYIPPHEAGMMPNNIHNMNNMNNMHNMNNIHALPQTTQYHAVPEENVQPMNKPSDNVVHNGPTCLEFADHVHMCPLCSKFYNNDKTIYIIAIVILAIVCILLLKRVLETS